MKSIEDNVPPLTGIGGNISPYDPNDMSISHDDTQGNHSETESAGETESVTLGIDVDARTTNHSREENQKDNGNTPHGGTESSNISEPRNTALLDMLAKSFTYILKNRYVRNPTYLLFTILIYQASLKETAYSFH